MTTNEIVVRSRRRISVETVTRRSERDELTVKLEWLWRLRRRKWKSDDRRLYIDSRGNLVDDSSDEVRSERQRMFGGVK